MTTDTLKIEELQCDVLEDIAREYNAKIPAEDIHPHGCNCPYEYLELTRSRKDAAHSEYVNEYSCTTCGATTTNFHKLKFDETYMA